MFVLVLALTSLAAVQAPPPNQGPPPTNTHAATPARTAAGPVFDVASIKPNVSGDLRVSIQSSPGGRFTAINAPVRALVRHAYQLQDFELSAPPPPPGVADRIDRGSLPSIFTVLQQRLGLKMDAQHGAVNVWVIDRVEHPVER